MAVSGVRISCETSEMTSFLVCCNSCWRVTSAKGGPVAVTLARNRRDAQRKVARPRVAHRELALQVSALGDESRKRVRIDRSAQALGQILTHQAARRRAENVADSAIGKGDEAIGARDQQPVFHGAQGVVHKARAIQQTRVELAKRARLPLEPLG
jgi:hypothetical protein